MRCECVVKEKRRGGKGKRRRKEKRRGEDETGEFQATLSSNSLHFFSEKSVSSSTEKAMTKTARVLPTTSMHSETFPTTHGRIEKDVITHC